MGAFYGFAVSLTFIHMTSENGSVTSTIKKEKMIRATPQKPYSPGLGFSSSTSGKQKSRNDPAKK